MVRFLPKLSHFYLFVTCSLSEPRVPGTQDPRTPDHFTTLALFPALKS